MHVVILQNEDIDVACKLLFLENFLIYYYRTNVNFSFNFKILGENLSPVLISMNYTL